MEIAVGVGCHVVVDCEIDTLNVDATTEDVRRDTNALIEVFELLVAVDTIVCQSDSLTNVPLGLTVPLG